MLVPGTHCAFLFGHVLLFSRMAVFSDGERDCTEVLIITFAQGFRRAEVQHRKDEKIAKSFILYFLISILSLFPDLVNLDFNYPGHFPSSAVGFFQITVALSDFEFASFCIFN